MNIICESLQLFLIEVFDLWGKELKTFQRIASESENLYKILWDCRTCELSENFRHEPLP